MADADTPEKGPWWKNPAFLGPIIVALIAGMFGIIGPLINRGETNSSAVGTPSGCSVSGQVLNADSNQGFVGLPLGYAPSGSGYADEEQFTYLNTTGAGGSYMLDCSSVQPGSMVAAQSNGWGDCIWVSRYPVPASGNHTGVNLSLSDGAQTTLGDIFGIPKYSSCVPPGGGN